LNTKTPLSSILTPALFVATLGYFVDVFDLLLFGIVRVASLKDLGLAPERLLEVGLHLINMQMMGMLLGGILWGVWGDKKGRVSVLFGSILLYSIANILNAFVGSLGENAILGYALCRFFAGVGLAGELGAAITLVSETLSAEHRGYGTAIVAGLGLFGGVAASLVSEYLSWSTAYIVGGVMGLCLLIMRMSISESTLFSKMEKNVAKGDLTLFLKSPSKLLRYLRCILIGLPTWFTIGILVTFSPELASALGIVGQISAAKAIFYAYIGISLGDLLSGILSQLFKTRRKIIITFLIATAGANAFYVLFGHVLNVSQFYALCAVLGIVTGYWAVFVTTASEQFGTNVRATVTTTVPNFVRGSLVILTISFEKLKGPLGLVGSATAVGLVCLCIALWAAWGLEETYGKDLNFIE
jgi:MFS family permease